jgi:phosphate butyryltransferase
VTCREKGEEPLAVFDTRIEDSIGNLVCDGVADIDTPRTKTFTEPRDLPSLIVDQKDLFARLVALAAQLSPLVTAVVCPEDQHSLGGAVLSAEKGLIRPVFVGDTDRIRNAAAAIDANIVDWPIVQESDQRAAAARAVAMVLAGEATAIMKGAGYPWLGSGSAMRVFQGPLARPCTTARE